jgi:hypothetical protein
MDSCIVNMKMLKISGCALGAAGRFASRVASFRSKNRPKNQIWRKNCAGFRIFVRPKPECPLESMGLEKQSHQVYENKVVKSNFHLTIFKINRLSGKWRRKAIRLLIA